MLNLILARTELVNYAYQIAFSVLLAERTGQASLP